MQSIRILVFGLSCILFGCSRTGPAAEDLYIEIKQSLGDQNLSGGTAQLPANSGIRLLSVKPNSRVTVVQEVQDGQVKTLYETTVPDGTDPVVVPITTPSSGGPIIVVVSHSTIEPKIIVRPRCMICYQCCPSKKP